MAQRVDRGGVDDSRKPLKLSEGGSHPTDVTAAGTVANPPLRVKDSDEVAARSVPADGFAALYGRRFHDICRWLRAMGAPDSDLEDLAQEVFLVVRRRLEDTEVREEGSWLYGICRKVMSDHRRRAWWKNLFSRRADVPLEGFAGRDDPARTYERREDVRRVRAILDAMSLKRRSALVLFELEGFSGEEIAALEKVPLKTVWTRLHHARREFLERMEALERSEEVEP